MMFISILSFVDKANHVDVHIDGRLYDKVTKASFRRLCKVLDRCDYDLRNLPSPMFTGAHLENVVYKGQ